MQPIPTDILRELEALRARLVDGGMPPSTARLYAQFSRVRELQPSLPTWTQAEALLRFDEALQLVDLALIARAGDDTTWRASARRAAEFLEWLAQPGVFDTDAPLHLLAAATYQFAGYPARAYGLLQGAENDSESALVHAALRGDFVALLDHLRAYWSAEPGQQADGNNWAEAIPRQVTGEVASVFGLVCAALRWGDVSRLERAIAKLEAVTKLMLHSRNQSSWLLSRLCTEAVREYARSALRVHCAPLLADLGPNGQVALERYFRLAFLGNRGLTWPSQVRGIARLITDQSFALCTPTGSGKTTIAEIAILTRLFALDRGADVEAFGPFEPAPLVMYLVPSRALAAEVETKLARVVRHFPIRVTALYGGTDFGPTDAAITVNERMIVIATYEKAEALLRFIGPRLLQRLALCVIDEAHGVQFEDQPEVETFVENRALRLEALIARLLARVAPNQQRVIALSAVAGGIEKALAAWAAGDSAATPEIVSYRSTRQIIGRLECLPNGAYEILYDLLDGAPLQFNDPAFRESPYVRNPFPDHPPAPEWNRYRRADMRLIPAVLWAAMHVAASPAPNRGTVLIAILQNPDWYARDFLILLEQTWAGQELPLFFVPPTEERQLQLWSTCLSACADYFGRDSYEYRLLTYGICLHHGKMPGSLARLLVQVIEQGIVQIVAATSTLSEGINIPVSLILLTSLTRFDGDLPAQQFANLAGRAGRPGLTTEGRVLVALERGPAGPGLEDVIAQAQRRYRRLITELERRGANANQPDRSASALAQLLRLIERLWRQAFGPGEFATWLEQAAPADLAVAGIANLATALDTLDNVLLAAIVELEELTGGEREVDDLDVELRRIWARTYAHYAAAEEQRLADLFVRRGEALVTSVYQDREARRRLYRTGLAPLSGVQLLGLYPRLRDHLATGFAYATWNSAEKLAYITTTIELIGTIQGFTLPARAGRSNVDYRAVLAWWLDPANVRRPPDVSLRAGWHRYITNNFTYRANWALGSIVALILSEAYGGGMPEPTLDRWEATGMPWAVYWMKDLLTWGTLDPVVAYLMTLGRAQTRPAAETLAAGYYPELKPANPEELLHAERIRSWCLGLPRAPLEEGDPVPPFQIPAKVLRETAGVAQRRWRVLPVIRNDVLRWIDPAGFPLAESELPQAWFDSYLHEYDFVLDLDQRMVWWSRYVTANPLLRVPDERR